ncbi:MAG: T9SS type A sorting domain-containing protein [Bacteroidota bacterium]
MKSIKIFSLIVLQIFFVQLAVAQSAVTLDNGRDFATAPTPVAEVETPTTSAEELSSPTQDDADIPGTYNLENRNNSSEWNLPNDLDALADEVATNLDADQMTAKIQDMEAQIKTLALYNEQLRLENKTIIKSLNSCCAGAGLDGENAYLLQNSPNPFKEMSQINFYIPAEVENARIEVRDVDGQLIEKYVVTPGGFGHIEMQGETLPDGTYVYALYIGDEIVDSKVMILTK